MYKTVLTLVLVINISLTNGEFDFVVSSSTLPSKNVKFLALEVIKRFLV